MKKFVSTVLASAIAVSPAFAQYTAQMNSSVNANMVNNTNTYCATDANGRPIMLTQDGRSYCQLVTTGNVAPTYTAPTNVAAQTQPNQVLGTYANQNLTTVPGATYVATGGAPAIAPAAAAYGYNGSNMILYATGAAMVGVAILAAASRSSTTSNH